MTKKDALKKAKRLWGKDATVSGRQRLVWRSPDKQTPSCFVGVKRVDGGVISLAVYGRDCTWEMAFEDAKQNGH